MATITTVPTNNVLTERTCAILHGGGTPFCVSAGFVTEGFACFPALHDIIVYKGVTNFL
ncbi:MAG TPA: hypothetical protein IAA65_03180 [Candidatus Galloscillospira excrementipullorum]|nr:hypothetical protein [Candidatus Galloscillospira excrementipullorum]